MRLRRFGELDAMVLGGSDGNGGGRGPAVVLLHGFQAANLDLASVVAALDGPRAARFVLPRGPLGGPASLLGRRSWWPLDVPRMERAMRAGDLEAFLAESPPGLAAARAQVAEALGEIEAQLGVPPERIVIGGYSQGAMLAADLLFRDERPFAGAVLLSCLLLAENEVRPLIRRRRNLPVLQCHGRDDPVLPIAGAERLVRLMRQAGMKVKWVATPGGHELSPRAVREVGAFLRRTLPAAASPRARVRG